MSDSTAYRGDYSITEPNDKQYDFVPFRGWQTTWTYQSTYPILSALALGFQVSSPGARQSITRVDGPIWRLVVIFDFLNDGVSVEVPINTWELLGNDVQKDLYEHPTTLALGIDTISAVKVAVQSVNSSSPGQEQSAKTTAVENLRSVAGANADVAEELFNLIIKGTTHYSVSEFVLRHTQTVSNTYQTQFALNNIEYIYTTDQLQSEAEIPSTIVFDIASIAEPSEKTGYLWGWLKRSPQISVVAGAKIQVTQEYWLDQWSTYAYFTKL